MSLPNPESMACPVCGGELKPLYETAHRGAPWMHRCVGCGFCVTSPMPPGLEEVYEDTYTASAEQEQKNRRLAPDYLRKLRPFLPAGKFRFLEVGGSHGWLAEYVREALGVEVLLLEPGRSAVAVANQRGLAAQAGFIEKFQPEQPYDVVCAAHVIEHVNDIHTFFAACQRALKPGGVFILLTPNAAAWKLAKFKRQWGWAVPDSHTLFLSPESAKKLLEQHGLEPVEIRGCRPDIAHYPFFLMRWLAERRARRARRASSGDPASAGGAAQPARRGGWKRWLTRPLVWSEYLLLRCFDWFFGKQRLDELLVVGRKR